MQLRSWKLLKQQFQVHNWYCVVCIYINIYLCIYLFYSAENILAKYISETLSSKCNETFDCKLTVGWDGKDRQRGCLLCGLIAGGWGPCRTKQTLFYLFIINYNHKHYSISKHSCSLRKQIIRGQFTSLPGVRLPIIFPGSGAKPLTPPGPLSPYIPL